MPQHFDTIIIGSGQSGNPLASAIAGAGRTAAVIERAFPGGTCINFGCTPTKTMVASAAAAYEVDSAPKYGVHVTGRSIDMAAVRQRKRDIVASWRAGVQSSLTDTRGITYMHGAARFLDSSTISVTKDDGSQETITAQSIVINTGGRPAIPAIPGLSDVPFLDSTSIMELDEVPEHLIILGGGYIACEFAQMFRRFGSQVTIVEKSDRLLAREDEDISQGVRELFDSDGIELALGAEATSVVASSRGLLLKIKSEGQGRDIEGSHLLTAIGRTPNTTDLDLSAAGVDVDAHGFVKVNDRLETTAPNIYATGDVKGGPAFTHISYDDYRVLKRRLIDGNETASIAGRLVPYTMFIDPQFARVGLSEQDAAKMGKEVRVVKLLMSHVARAVESAHDFGFMKAIVDSKTDQILGCAILGVDGGEIMAMLEIAMMGKLPYTVLRDGIFAHPTLAESLNNLFASL